MSDKAAGIILILTATFGDGHKQVANALSEAVGYSHSNVEPIVIDIMEWIHPYLYPFSNYVYKSSMKKFPHLYGYLYKKTRVKSSFSIKLNSLFSFGMRSMLEIIQRTQPSVVVSTYPFAAGIISKLKESKLINTPAVTIITDYTDHSYWIHPLTDEYIVGSTGVRDRLISLGVDSYKIKNTGIPVRHRFCEYHSRETLAMKYCLSPKKFTLLVMGGGEGFIGKGLTTIQTLKSISDSIQLIIVCGRNKKLRKQLEEELEATKSDILIMGYCENIHELMAISDLMITKPGGVTTSEAIAMGLPLLIYKPLPGQEEDNANYLLQSGLAIPAENEADLIFKVNSVLNDTNPLKLMRQRTKQFQTKNSSLAALEVIISTVNRIKQENAAI